MKLVLVNSNDYKNVKDFSLALTKEYMKSVNPSQVKILIYNDDTFAARFTRDDVREVDKSEKPKKLFYVSWGKNAKKEVDKLNDVMERKWANLIKSTPFVTPLGKKTLVFVVGEIVDTDSDDEKEDDGPFV